MTMTVMCDGRQTLSTTQAAQELELRTGECELATQLGEVRTVPAGTADRAGRARAAPPRPGGAGGDGPGRGPRRVAPG
ncbi:DUF6397 family protein, partial [Streptomyces sp. NPDC059152]|uniref:DUF6397 family protein n=1 Tax=Streptomyces sp. NPDC059152 TaxID=3346742 RepID=UPI0036811240